MGVVELDDREGAARWDAYVAPRTTTATDLAAWRRVVRDAYGLRSWFLAADEGGRVRGVLGLYEARSPVFGRYLTTAAFGNDGGLYFDDAAARDALLAAARDLADREDADYLLVRTRGEALPGLRDDAHYRTAVIDLGGGADAVWERVLPAKTRNQVRRGMREGFTVAAGPGQLGPFLDVFHRHMRDLGSPAPGRRFYEAVLEHLGDHAEFIVVRDGGALAAGALLFTVNGTAMNYHTVALREFNRRCPNYLLYWRMIEWSCGHGCVRFDMGRSEAGSANLAFKENWGPQVLTLHYGYQLRRLRDIPYVDPRNPRYRLPIAIWRRLPLALTRRVGPRLMPGLL